MKKFNTYSQMILILSFILVPISFFSVLDEMKVLRSISLLFIVVIIIFGIIALKQIKKTGSNGRGYVITAMIISSIALAFFILLNIANFISYDQKQLTILEDKNEQNSSMIKIPTKRASLDIRTLDFNNDWVKSGITEENIVNADVVKTMNNFNAILITLDENNSQLLGVITSENIGKMIAVFIDDVLVSTPIVREEISSGQLMISGLNFTDDELFNFRARLLGFYYKDEDIK